ncbi:hypothetical protein T02_7801, partial [Trichinella nativa]
LTTSRSGQRRSRPRIRKLPGQCTPCLITYSTAWECWN